MASDEPQLTPAEFFQNTARHDHLMWSRMSFTWTEKRKLLIAPHIEIIASVFDDILAGRRKRVLLNIAPRHGKTELGVKSLSSRIFAVNPRARVMHTSYSDELVQKNSRNVRGVLTNQHFQLAFPGTRMAPDSFAKKHWNTTEGAAPHAPTPAACRDPAPAKTSDSLADRGRPAGLAYRIRSWRRPAMPPWSSWRPHPFDSPLQVRVSPRDHPGTTGTARPGRGRVRQNWPT